jgi:phosphodiesterase/alkaline phosphatase D-like protein
VPSTPAATAYRTLENNIKISWNSVSGASGYQLYRSASPTGSYSLIKTTSSTHYENKSLTENRTYYYKVRAYRTVSGNKIYGNYSAIVSAATKYMPKISSTNPSSTYYNINYISIHITNNGTLPITIYSDGAYLWDDESYDYDRDLVIVDNYLNVCTSVTLYPGDSEDLTFKILGDSTRYTPYSSILFFFIYDDILYYADLSYYYGNWYEAYID